MILTVTVPDQRTFDAYYYGKADEVHMVPNDGPRGGYTYTLVYSDPYHARYQEGRFASGLYFCRLMFDTREES